MSEWIRESVAVVVVISLEAITIHVSQLCRLPTVCLSDSRTPGGAISSVLL